MKKVIIKLSTIEDVRKLVDSARKYSPNATLKSNGYTVCAGSIMGIFALDLLEPVELNIESKNYAPLLNEISKCLVLEQSS